MDNRLSELIDFFVCTYTVPLKTVKTSQAISAFRRLMENQGDPAERTAVFMATLLSPYYAETDILIVREAYRRAKAEDKDHVETTGKWSDAMCVLSSLMGSFLPANRQKTKTAV